MTWLEIFLVELAGEMRLERAIPLVVKKLHECGEILSEECVEALGKIGTDVAAEAVTEGWLEAVWDYRLYATSALDKIHSDMTVRKCLELLPQDKDLDIRTKLASDMSPRKSRYPSGSQRRNPGSATSWSKAFCA